MNSANRQAPTPGKPLSEHENVNGGSNGTSSPTKESRSSNQASPANGGNPFGEADEWEEEDSEGKQLIRTSNCHRFTNVN